MSTARQLNQRWCCCGVQIPRVRRKSISSSSCLNQASLALRVSVCMGVSVRMGCVCAKCRSKHSGYSKRGCACVWTCVWACVCAKCRSKHSGHSKFHPTPTIPTHTHTHTRTDARTHAHTHTHTHTRTHTYRAIEGRWPRLAPPHARREPRALSPPAQCKPESLTSPV